MQLCRTGKKEPKNSLKIVTSVTKETSAATVLDSFSLINQHTESATSKFPNTLQNVNCTSFNCSPSV